MKFHFELHDSQIDSIEESPGRTTIHFSKAFLYPLLPSGKIDTSKQIQQCRLILVLLGGEVNGNWPDFNDESYIIHGAFSGKN